MAPLPPNLTNRLFLDYVTGTQPTSQEHTMLVRFTGTAENVTVAQARVLDFLTALGAGSFRSSWRVIRARISLAGTNISVPTPVSTALAAFVGTQSVTGYASRMETVEDTFQGRSTLTGRRVDLSLYRAAGDADNNFRIPGGSAGGLSASVRAAVAALQNGVNTAGAFVALDGSQTIWYDYMNQNYNSYWERRLRSV